MAGIRGSFGQVCMRAVLDAEPFRDHKGSAVIGTMVIEEFDCGEGEKAI
jgi:hypothetical protein